MQPTSEHVRPGSDDHQSALRGPRARDHDGTCNGTLRGRQASARLGNLVEIAEGIEYTPELSQDGAMAVVRSVFRGTSRLLGPSGSW